jgi:hypothetical protein
LYGLLISFDCIDHFAANGGEDHWFYFNNQVKSAGQEGLWRKAPISGETRPENQPLVFKSDYARRTLNKQDFMECVNVTHASYVYVISLRCPFHYLQSFMTCCSFLCSCYYRRCTHTRTHRFHNNAFDHKYEGDELRNALFASTRMGYNFVVRKVDVAKSTATPNAVDVDVTVEQVGIAPFYYPLSLVLDCDDPILKWPRAYQGVEALIDKGAQGLFRFEGVPATPSCLSTISLILDSKNAYRNRPIKFAQGKTGVVALSIPVPTVAAGKAAAADVDPDIQSPSIQVTFTIVQIINGQSKDSMPVADGTVIDLAKVGRSLNLRANVSPDDDIDVIFQFANRTVVERSDPFTLLPSRVLVPYLSFPGEKTIRVSVVDEDDDDVTLERQTLVFQIVDSAAKLL